jgi:hypothetical protein
MHRHVVKVKFWIFTICVSFGAVFSQQAEGMGLERWDEETVQKVRTHGGQHLLFSWNIQIPFQLTTHPDLSTLFQKVLCSPIWTYICYLTAWGFEHLILFPAKNQPFLLDIRLSNCQSSQLVLSTFQRDTSHIFTWKGAFLIVNFTRIWQYGSWAMREKWLFGSGRMDNKNYKMLDGICQQPNLGPYAYILSWIIKFVVCKQQGDLISTS